MAVHRQVRLGGAELVPDIDRTDAWLLFVDGVPQSGVDLADPAYLEFEYIRRMGHVVDLAFPPGAPVHALHLGGGALTLPRYIAHTRPGSRQLVAEVDDALTELVNIGVSRAAVSLRKMVGEQVILSVPSLELMERAGAGVARIVERLAPDGAAVADAFRLTGFFLVRDLFAPRGQPLPDSRRAFLAAAAKADSCEK